MEGGGRCGTLTGKDRKRQEEMKTGEIKRGKREFHSAEWEEKEAFVDCCLVFSLRPDRMNG